VFAQQHALQQYCRHCSSPILVLLSVALAETQGARLQKAAAPYATVARGMCQAKFMCMHSSVAVQAYSQICLECGYSCLPHTLLSQSLAACSALDDAAHSALHLLHKQQQQQQHASMMCMSMLLVCWMQAVQLSLTLGQG
jgi:hypothetical protein